MSVSENKFASADHAVDGNTEGLYAEASVYVQAPDWSTIDESKLEGLLQTLLEDVFSGTVTVGSAPVDPDVFVPDDPAVTNEAAGKDA